METAQTADYSLLVLLELGRKDGQTLTELAGRLDINRAVLGRIVATLHGRALVTRTMEGQYVLGPGLLALGSGIQHDLARVARLPLLEFADAIQEAVVLSAPDGDEAEVIARRDGNRGPLRIQYSLGFRHSLARGASGLAILAFLDESVAHRLLPAAELTRLEEIRESGYAKTVGEIREFIVGLAVPVLLQDGSVAGSLTVVVPTARSEAIDDLLPDLRAVARNIGDEFWRLERFLDEQEVRR